MLNETTLLHSSTEALAYSEDAVHLLEQKERIQRAVTIEDPAQVLDTSKAFLETVFKTILQDREGDAEIPANFTQLFRAVSTSMPMSQDAGVAGSLGNMAKAIVHHVGELRNAYGATSHGDDGYHTCPVEMNDAHMVVQFVDGLAGFVLKKHRDSANPEIAARIHYNDYSEFNGYWDEQYEGYELPYSSTGKSIIPASELLFTTDLNGYREALLQFRASEEEEGEDEE